MKYDFYKKLYEKNAALFHARPLLKKALPIVDKAVTSLFVVAYAMLCLYAYKNEISVTEWMQILFPPALCLLVVSVLRLAVEKPRPYAEQGANITPLIKKKRGAMRSFPSRHIACAMVIASVFLPFFPTVAWILYFFGCVLAYLRFSMGLHYPSDLLAGGIVGIFSGMIAFIL